MDGKRRRLARLFRHDGKALVVALDDGLIGGPIRSLRHTGEFLRAIGEGGADGILVFGGILARYGTETAGLSAIVNLTASIKGQYHTEKVWCTTVEEAPRDGADAVAVHVNVTDEHEGAMLKTLGRATGEAHRAGLPVLAIVYPRQRTKTGETNYEEEREQNPQAYGHRIQHCIRIGVELGADIVKTQYTGNPETFHFAIDSDCDVPVLIAGGQQRPWDDLLSDANDALHAGASGFSFGRNIFEQQDPHLTVKKLSNLLYAEPTS